VEEIPHRPSKDRLEAFGSAVGAVLKRAREDRHWSVYRLSQESGVDERGIRRIEEGETSPSVDTLFRLVSTLGIPLSSVFAKAEEMTMRE